MVKVIDWKGKRAYAKTLSDEALQGAHKDCLDCVKQNVPDAGYYSDEASIYREEIIRRAEAANKKSRKRSKPVDYNEKHLSQLVGKKIVGLIKDGGGTYGFKTDAGQLVWIMCDPEGNGPGHLDIQDEG